MEHTKGKLDLGNTTSDNIILVGGKKREYICSIRVQQTGGGAIAEAMKPKRIANAKELVRRWNAFEEGGIIEELRKACKGLVHRGSCIIQSHQCVEHKGGDCCDLAYMLDAIQKGKAALAKS